MMQAQPSRDRSRSSSSTEAVEVVNPAGIPEPPFLIWCARTSHPEFGRSRIREAAQQGMNWPLLRTIHHGSGCKARVWRSFHSR